MDYILVFIGSGIGGCVRHGCNTLWIDFHKRIASTVKKDGGKIIRSLESNVDDQNSNSNLQSQHRISQQQQQHLYAADKPASQDRDLNENNRRLRLENMKARMNSFSSNYIIVQHFGIVVINILGSFTLGMLVGYGVDKSTKLLLGTGFCGGFTTFSTYSVDVVQQWKDFGKGETDSQESRQRLKKALFLAAITNVFSLSAASIGLYCGLSLRKRIGG